MTRSFLLLSLILALLFWGMSACSKAEQKAEKSISPQEQSAETVRSMEEASPEMAEPMEGMMHEPGEMADEIMAFQEEAAEGPGYGADEEEIPQVMTKTKELGEAMEEKAPTDMPSLDQPMEESMPEQPSIETQ